MEISHGTAPAAPLEQALWEEHRDRVYRYLLRLTGEPETAADLTQETFLQAIRDLRRSPAARAYAAPWLLRIATNRAMDLFRRRRRIRWLPWRPELYDQRVDDAAEALTDRDLVDQVLRRLPPESASILLLRDAEGFSAPEIATMLDLEPAAVRKRISRAREAFRVEYLRLKGDQT